VPSAPSIAAKSPARSHDHPARRPATSAHPVDLEDGRTERELGARFPRPHAGPGEGEEGRGNDGRFDQRPLATGNDENVATPELLSCRDLLADDLRPPVHEPEDEGGGERRCRHDPRVMAGLEGDADDRGHEKRPVDGRSEPVPGRPRYGAGMGSGDAKSLVRSRGSNAGSDNHLRRRVRITA
jgi:hypothetical protein